MTHTYPPLTVITGPSGVGKTTLVEKLLERHPQLWLSISATTRLPRNGEVGGKEYLFLSRKEFEGMLSNDNILEFAEFAGNLYGTPRQPIEDHLESGQPVLLILELVGARQIRRRFPNAKLIFVAPPSFEELERRIRSRNSEDESKIQSRLSRAKIEISASKEFDAVVINDTLERALCEIEGHICLPEIIKPCPFCGGEANVEDHRLVWSIICSNCGACVLGDRAPEPETDLPDSYCESIRQSAITRWNHRI
jgi:guanylate kinase